MEHDTLDDFLAEVVALCREFDGSVTSWIRTPKRNREKGGVPASRHQSGFAVDVVLDAMTAQKIGAFQAEAMRMGLRVLEEKRGQAGWHLHVQTVGQVGFVTL